MKMNKKMNSIMWELRNGFHIVNLEDGNVSEATALTLLDEETSKKCKPNEFGDCSKCKCNSCERCKYYI